MSWHGDPALMETYALGILDEVHSSSIEAHLLRCERCREAIARHVGRDRIEGMWAAIEERLDIAPQGMVERLLGRLGMPDHVARLLAATPSLRLSWFGAVAIALAFATVAARAGSVGVLQFLVVAPLIPLAGIAVAYGPRVDPTYEVGLAAPMRSFRLLMIRALAVLITSMALVGIAAIALPHLDWTAAAWLLPSIALSLGNLALSSYWSPQRATVGLVAAWTLAVVLGERFSSVPYAAFRAAPQAAFAMIAVASIVVLARRREAFDTRRGR
ncbi:MAG: zf-HC2 domain-containing protein [Actinobacteria bacterium]|nr:MAG: zf-HC2 domain-containing protein [Actinomycetota bacterium]